MPKFQKSLNVGIVFWLLTWEVTSRLIIKDPDLFPSLTEVVLNMFELFFVNHEIYQHLYASFFRFLVASFFAGLLGYGLAILAGSIWGVRTLMQSLVSLTYSIPKVALIPIMLLFFGTGDLQKIVLIFLGVFFLVYINVYHKTCSIVEGPLSDVIKVYKIKGMNYWFQILVKGSFGSFLVGLKAGLGYGLTLVVVSEISLSNRGLGYFIWSAWDSFRILDMYTGIFIIAILGAIINLTCDFLIRRQSHELTN